MVLLPAALPLLIFFVSLWMQQNWEAKFRKVCWFGSVVKSLPRIGKVLCSSLSTTKTKASTNRSGRRQSKYLRLAQRVRIRTLEGFELCLRQSVLALFQKAFCIT